MKIIGQKSKSIFDVRKMDNAISQESNDQSKLSGFGLIKQNNDEKNEINLSHQEIIDNKLRIIIFLPGIDKTSLQIRNRAEVLAVSAKYKEHIGQIFHQSTTLEIRINLIVKINPTSTQASYVDGILELYLDLV